MTRLVLILALVWQSLLAGFAPVPVRGPVECAPACCQTIERVTCCGERIVEHVCGKTGGACLCGASNELPEPVPQAPMPQHERDSLLAIGALAPPLVCCGPRAEVRPSFRRGQCVPDGRSHNHVQAFLGVWRT